MKIKLTEDIWVIQTLRLVQALLGAISANFRMVGLAHDGDRWKLIFVLEAERGDDREEIEDIAVEFEALQEGPIEYDLDVSVTRDALAWPPQSVWVVYRRRET